MIVRRLLGALYGPGAAIYDRFTRFAFAGEWQRWQMMAMHGLPVGGDIVELGCGTGSLAAKAARSFRSWTAIDISHKMISRARPCHRPPRPSFIRASANTVPLRSGSADIVVATFPSDFIFDLRVTEEISRLLKPNGVLVVVLTAELRAVGIRRRCVRAVSTILAGSTGRVEAWTPAFAGFAGKSEWQTTEYGRSLVYAGRRL